MAEQNIAGPHSRLRLGVNGMLWSKAPPSDLAFVIRELEELGYDSYWTAEAYGSDAFVPLSWGAAGSSHLRFGTAVAQISARTPAATAMAAMTMDHLTGGRFVLGLGVSGPQVVEGWYGQDFKHPLSRTREYVGLVREIIAREKPVEFEGEHYRLPLRGGTGLGKPLKSALHPLRADMPIYIGAEGPKNIGLAREIADGWLTFLFSPYHEENFRKPLEEGAARARPYRPWEEFEVAASTWVSIDASVEKAADRLRPTLALYIGGMGTRARNFHADLMTRMGYGEDVAQIQELFFEGRRAEAAAAVPTRLIEDVALVGPPEKLAEDLRHWRSSMVTTLLVNGDMPALRTLGRLVA
ncbi:LLM class F420-dependent oxidoreductase [Actinomadura sp. 3N407]|uniref:LLM class F420-dependent oxidoreductase n=1 Tax=Actinomadura sp. 3N407 TaxID=3457423 RepID=UPI003FCCC02F